MIIDLEIQGRRERCEVLRVWPAGTIDVEVLRTGRCYRLTGCRGWRDAPRRPAWITKRRA